MIIKNGSVFNENGGFNTRDLFIHNHIITEDPILAASDGIVIDATAKYVLPGLVDIHSHGAIGHDFCDADIEGLKAILSYEKRSGITSYCPTSMTLPIDRLAEIFKTINQIYPSPECASLPGINMEGPFISSVKMGAQNEEYILAPNADIFRELNNIAKGKIKLVTIACEAEGAYDFIDKIKNETVISLGHTAASYEQADIAFKKGIRHVTHLCNAMSPFNHRNPGVIGAAFDNKEVFVEVICDGVHVHPSMIRMLFEMFGPDRVVFISDSTECTGMPDGEYKLGDQTVIKSGDLATLSDGTIAGSVANLYSCMKNAVDYGIPLCDAVKAATVNPAKSIGCYPAIGCLLPGATADILIVDHALELKQVI